MPPADQTGTGQTILFNNLGPQSVTIKSSTGVTLASIAQGEQWQLYLIDNSTASGTWRVFRYGAATAQAQASALAGFGLAATGSTAPSAAGPDAAMASCAIRPMQAARCGTETPAKPTP